MLLLIDNGQ